MMRYGSGHGMSLRDMLLKSSDRFFVGLNLCVILPILIIWQMLPGPTVALKQLGSDTMSGHCGLNCHSFSNSLNSVAYLRCAVCVPIVFSSSH